MLDLDEASLRSRERLLVLARELLRACLVGTPAPVVEEMWRRMKNPRPGDVVFAHDIIHSADSEKRCLGFGVLLAKRREPFPDWDDEEDGPNSGELIWYVQYGPTPEDVCRWENAEFFALPGFTTE